MGQEIDQSRRRFLRTTGTGVAAATALSSTTAATSSGSGSKTSNRTLNLELSHPIGSLDPVQSVNTVRSEVLEQIVDGLTTFQDGNLNATGALATGFEVSDDYRTYRFDLDEGAVFHGDYGRVTASDVVYSLERLAASPHSWRRGFIFDLLGVEHDRDDSGNYVSGSIGVEAIDPTTVEIRLRTPFHGALEVLAYAAFGIIPEGIVGDIPGYSGDMSYDDFKRAPVGAGPFAFASWEPTESVTVERFPEYYGNKPWVGEVSWQITPPGDKHDRILAGDIDLWSPRPGKIDPDLRTVERTEPDGTTFGTYGPMENGLTANFQSQPALSIFYLGFNCERVPKYVRVAMAHLVDQSTLTESFWRNDSIPAAHFTPPKIYPGRIDAYEDHASSYPYGLSESQTDAAAEVMEGADYGPDNQYELSYVTFPGDVHQAFGEWLEQQASEAHIDLTVDQIGFPDLTGRVADGRVEAFFLGWVADWPGAENILQLLNPPYTQNDNPFSVSSFNWGGTPAAADARDAFQTILENHGPSPADESARREAYITIEEANWTDVPAIPLMHTNEARYWYDWVDPEPFGSMGRRNQKYTDVKLRPKQSANGKGNGR